MGPPEPAKDRRAGRRIPVPVGLLGMLVLVAGVEGLVASHRLDVTSPATLTWSLSAEAARREARECRVLCFGESLMKHGLLPGVLEARLGGRAFNLAVCAAQRQQATICSSKPLKRARGPRRSSLASHPI